MYFMILIIHNFGYHSYKLSEDRVLAAKQVGVIVIFIYTTSGFGGLGVSVLASGTQDRRFAPDRSRQIFPTGKIHSMPSFRGEVK
jgi:hypothetical protein